MKWLKKLHISIVNSSLWFYLYYKHTKDFKNQLTSVEARAKAFREQVLGKGN